MQGRHSAPPERVQHSTPRRSFQYEEREKRLLERSIMYGYITLRHIVAVQEAKKTERVSKKVILGVSAL